MCEENLNALQRAENYYADDDEKIERLEDELDHKDTIIHSLRTDIEQALAKTNTENTENRMLQLREEFFVALHLNFVSEFLGNAHDLAASWWADRLVTRTMELMDARLVVLVDMPKNYLKEPEAVPE